MSHADRTADLRSSFRTLHERGCFVMPNPWDLGSARLFTSLGFPALATTSSGFAWSQGRADNHVPLAGVLGHLTQMAASVDVPFNADFEGGFAVEPEAVAANVTAACGTGIAGLSIEDSTGDTAAPLFEFELAVARVRAARAAIERSGSGVLLTARSEGFLVGRPDLRETVRRLQAFVEAGAECVFAPGLRERDHLATVIREVAPAPVNVIVSSDFTTVRDVADLGARRISVGGALARVGWRAVIDAAAEIAADGTFTRLATAVPGDEMNRRFATTD
jgi:2-methylisocitrate lyase-like PEP mutase family enzyme